MAGVKGIKPNKSLEAVMPLSKIATITHDMTYGGLGGKYPLPNGFTNQNCMIIGICRIEGSKTYVQNLDSSDLNVYLWDSMLVIETIDDAFSNVDAFKITLCSTN